MRHAELGVSPHRAYTRNRSTMATKSIAVPDGIYERAQAAAVAEGTSLEAFAAKALERDLARRWLESIGRESDARRGSMTDAEVETTVERAVQESRARS